MTARNAGEYDSRKEGGANTHEEPELQNVVRDGTREEERKERKLERRREEGND